MVLPDGSSQVIPHSQSAETDPSPRRAGPRAAATTAGPTDRRPLGTICGARSGDKGGNANIGVWTWDDQAYAWLVAFLDSDRLQRLIPESAGLEVFDMRFIDEEGMRHTMETSPYYAAWVSTSAATPASRDERATIPSSVAGVTFPEL